MDLGVSGPGVVFFAAPAFPAYVFGPQASVDIAPAFDVLVPVSPVVAWLDSPGRPRFPAFPNADYHANSSSSFELVRKESVHSSTGARAIHALCSILSSRGLHQNRNSEPSDNKPNPGYNNVSGTNGLPIHATTSHSRKTGPHLYPGQRKHTSQVLLREPEVLEIRWVVAEKSQCLRLPLPSS